MGNNSILFYRIHDETFFFSFESSLTLSYCNNIGTLIVITLHTDEFMQDFLI